MRKTNREKGYLDENTSLRPSENSEEGMAGKSAENEEIFTQPDIWAQKHRRTGLGRRRRQR